MLLKILLAEGRRFCEMTSVRGVGRIVKTKSRLMYFMWIVGVLTCSTMLVWQVGVITKRFATHPVNSLFTQAPSWQFPTFPDITVCNLSPLVHEKYMPLTYTEYVNTVTKEFNYERVKAYFEPKLSISRASYDNIYDHVLTPAAFFNNFPVTHGVADNENKSLILRCAYFDWDYAMRENDSCLADIEPIWNEDYYKCYKFKIRDRERSDIRGFSAIFYVEDILENPVTDYDLNLRNSRATGVRVCVHPPGTEPNMKLGISVSPGMESTIKLDMTIRSILPHPHSNCTTKTTHSNDDTTYTEDYCHDLCLQKRYLKLCRCVSSTRQFSYDQLKEANYTICGNLSINSVNSSINWAGLSQLICAEDFGQHHEACSSECVAPCREFQYDTSISSAVWPHSTSHASLYSTFIKGNPRFGSKFDEYQTVINNALTNRTLSNELLQQLDSKRLIEDSFLQLNVMFNSHRFYEHHDVETFPVETMGAQLGGVLSFWLSLTVTFLFEIVEMLYTAFTKYFYAKRVQKSKKGTEEMKKSMPVGLSTSDEGDTCKSSFADIVKDANLVSENKLSLRDSGNDTGTDRKLSLTVIEVDANAVPDNKPSLTDIEKDTIAI